MSGRQRFGAVALIVLVATAAFIADQLTKQWALLHLQSGVTQGFIPHLIGLTLVTNTGTAFGMWRSERLVGLLLPPLICVGIIAYMVHREKQLQPLSLSERIGFALVLGGAAGNVCDRLTRGQVTDFLFFQFWTSFPVFNLADALIDIGVALILLHSLTAQRKQWQAADGDGA